jgi:hypothetical protein
MRMSNKKSFWVGLVTGVFTLALIEGLVFGGKVIYDRIQEENYEIAYDEGIDDEEIVDSTGVFADSGNPIITDTYEEKFKIEVIPPSGYTIDEDYQSAYYTGFYNETQKIRLDYSIENYTAEEMQSYYEFQTEFFEQSDDAEYTNVSITEMRTMEVNGYQVNYLSLSYTANGNENYTEYCAYVMLNDEYEFMCNIYGYTQDVSEDVIKDCFASQLPVSK